MSEIEPQMVTIPGGEFLMGCDAGAAAERPVHSVFVDTFSIAQFSITNRLFRLFVESTGYPTAPKWESTTFSDPDQPVTSVSWFDAVAYCKWLEAVTGKRYRLPSEAEWERAARGGLEGKLYTWGDEPPQSQPGYLELWLKGPERVGRRPPNGYLLYDMAENIHEWCSDWFDESYYQQSPTRNPQGPAAGTRRSSRGGSWRHQVKISRVSARSSIPPHFRYSDYGFRCAMDL